MAGDRCRGPPRMGTRPSCDFFSQQKYYSNSFVILSGGQYYGQTRHNCGAKLLGKFTSFGQLSWQKNRRQLVRQRQCVENSLFGYWQKPWHDWSVRGGEGGVRQMNSGHG